MQYDTVWRIQKVGPFELQLKQLVSFEQAVDVLITELQAQGKADITAEDCPYFGQVWAAALGLSEELLKLDIAGKRVLELGCGLALPSMIAAKRGAICTAMDIHRDVGDFLASNLHANNLSFDSLQYICADWASFAPDHSGYDLIMASDVLYENHHPGNLIDFFSRSLAKSGQVLIVDPCRWYHQDFLKLLQAKGYDAEMDYRWTTEQDKPVKLATIKAEKQDAIQPPALA